MSEERSALRMHAYYFGFTATGVELVDRILSAVAHAGKGYHNTSEWGEDNTESWGPFRGTSYAEWMQRAAEDAAAEMRRLGAERELLRAALVKLVGVDGSAELREMEAVMRLMPAPADDKAATVDAIRALIATIEGSEARKGQDAVTP